jgi:hypothetical protein
MEVPQENSLCSHIKQAKCHFFFLSFAKTENRKVEHILPRAGVGGLIPMGGGGGREKV